MTAQRIRTEFMEGALPATTQAMDRAKPRPAGHGVTLIASTALCLRDRKDAKSAAGGER